VSKNLRKKGQADTDCWNALFDTLTGFVARVFTLSKKRADCVGLSPSLDRHRDLASEWQAAMGTGRLSGAERRRADPPPVSRPGSVESPHALVAAASCAGEGSVDTDDHRCSLSGGQRRNLGAHERWGGGQADGGA
jgi:hypothetical protein